MRPRAAPFPCPVPGARSRSPAMAYRELVRRWHEAVRAADRGHWDAALDAFGGIAEPPARICFNVGCVQLLAGRPEAALRVSESGAGGSRAWAARLPRVRLGGNDAETRYGIRRFVSCVSRGNASEDVEG